MSSQPERKVEKLASLTVSKSPTDQEPIASSALEEQVTTAAIAPEDQAAMVVKTPADQAPTAQTAPEDQTPAEPKIPIDQTTIVSTGPKASIMLENQVTTVATTSGNEAASKAQGDHAEVASPTTLADQSPSDIEPELSETSAPAPAQSSPRKTKTSSQSAPSSTVANKQKTVEIKATSISDKEIELQNSFKEPKPQAISPPVITKAKSNVTTGITRDTMEPAETATSTANLSIVEAVATEVVTSSITSSCKTTNEATSIVSSTISEAKDSMEQTIKNEMKKQDANEKEELVIMEENMNTANNLAIEQNKNSDNDINGNGNTDDDGAADNNKEPSCNENDKNIPRQNKMCPNYIGVTFDQTEINFKSDIEYEAAKAKEIADQDEDARIEEVIKAKDDVEDKRKKLENALELMEKVKGADHTCNSLNSMSVAPFQMQLQPTTVSATSLGNVAHDCAINISATTSNKSTKVSNTCAEQTTKGEEKSAVSPQNTSNINSNSSCINLSQQSGLPTAVATQHYTSVNGVPHAGGFITPLGQQGLSYTPQHPYYYPFYQNPLYHNQYYLSQHSAFIQAQLQQQQKGKQRQPNEKQQKQKQGKKQKQQQGKKQKQQHGKQKKQQEKQQKLMQQQEEMKESPAVSSPSKDVSNIITNSATTASALTASTTTTKPTAVTVGKRHSSDEKKQNVGTLMLIQPSAPPSHSVNNDITSYWSFFQSHNHHLLPYRFSYLESAIDSACTNNVTDDDGNIKDDVKKMTTGARKCESNFIRLLNTWSKHQQVESCKISHYLSFKEEKLAKERLRRKQKQASSVKKDGADVSITSTTTTKETAKIEQVSSPEKRLHSGKKNAPSSCDVRRSKRLRLSSSPVLSKPSSSKPSPYSSSTKKTNTVTAAKNLQLLYPSFLNFSNLSRIFFEDAIRLKRGDEGVVLLRQGSWLFKDIMKHLLPGNADGYNDNNTKPNKSCFIQGYHHLFLRQSKYYIQLPFKVLNTGGSRLLCPTNTLADKKNYIRHEGMTIAFLGDIPKDCPDGYFMQWNSFFLNKNKNDVDNAESCKDIDTDQAALELYGVKGHACTSKSFDEPLRALTSSLTQIMLDKNTSNSNCALLNRWSLCMAARHILEVEIGDFDEYHRTQLSSDFYRIIYNMEKLNHEITLGSLTKLRAEISSDSEMVGSPSPSSQKKRKSKKSSTVPDLTNSKKK